MLRGQGGGGDAGHQVFSIKYQVSSIEYQVLSMGNVWGMIGGLVEGGFIGRVDKAK